MNQLKTIFVLFILITNILASASDDLTSNENKKLYYIFFVHGYHGNDKTFGSMGEGLINGLSSIRQDTEFRFKLLKYDTGNSNKNSYNFMNEIGEQIEAELKPEIDKGKDIKISLVAHSQGGLVSTIWYFQSMLFKKSKWNAYAQMTDAIITMGTPFWGSKAASFGLLAQEYAPKLAPHFGVILNKVFEKIGLGTSELESLAFGSEITRNFHERAIKLDSLGGLDKVFKVRPLAIAGAVPPTSNSRMTQWQNWLHNLLNKDLTDDCDQILSNFSNDKNIPENIYSPSSKTIKCLSDNTKPITLDFFNLNRSLFDYVLLKYFEDNGSGGYRYESDGAVPLSSARPNFIYYQNKNMKDVVLADRKIKFSDFKMNRFSQNLEEVPYVIVENLHASPWPDETFDMVAVPKHCENPYECNHPAFFYVLDHLLDCENPESNCNIPMKEILLEKISENTEKRFKRFEYNRFANQMSGFSVELNVELPKEYNIKVLEHLSPEEILNYIQFNRKPIEKTILGLGEIVNSDEVLISRNRPIVEENPLYEIYIAREKEMISTIARVTNEDNKTFFRVHLTGVIAPQITSDMNREQVRAHLNKYVNQKKSGFEVPFEIRLPGVHSVFVNAKVRPTFATYIDIKL